MSRNSSIRLELQGVVRQLAKDGLSGPKIAARLLADHGCRTTPRAVQRLLQGQAQTTERVAVPETNGLTGRQVRFIEEYLVTLNATEAARKAGYSARTAASQGADLLKHPKVRAALDKAIERRAIRVAVKADDVLSELLRIARVDIGQAFNPDGSMKALHEIPEDVRRAIAGVEVQELKVEGAADDGDFTTTAGTIRKVKFWDKVRGLELLMKHLGLLAEKQELEIKESPVHAALKRLQAAGKITAPPPADNSKGSSRTVV